MTEIDKTFDPTGVEDKWYKAWQETKSFKVNPNATKAPFVIIMPPPNVTGKLHVGHALDHTIQDVLVRLKRMQGHKTLWIPGQDHAGIATQAKVEEKIMKEQGKSKHDLGREEFLKETWKWKEEYGEHIINQVKKIGDSCDWDYFTFTMDKNPSDAVKKFFVDMYNKDLIYQSDYIVNWDTQLESAISDAEVEFKEVNGKFYHIQYAVKGSKEKLEIATTRPETMFGDTAVAVNPNDDRYEHLIGKTAIIPICNREVTIIGDNYVDMEVGTGCLKITPGHDFNDFEIGKRHNLEIINILSKDGKMNAQAGELEGLTTKEARKKTVAKLEEAGLLLEVKDHVHQVGHGERSKSVIEPMVSKQWFLNTSDMAKRSVDEVENENMKFFPKNWENTYYSYQKNPRPWCISRQLWWGHQIPIFYCQNPECNHTFASEKVESTCPKCNHDKVEQDPDVLDTWFSSGLFPLSTLGWPNEDAMKELGFNEFYPTATLVTGFDIIFFWVARMMMMCNEATGKSPFKDVYIHALVRDKDGKKMSKSVGNVIDPLEMIEKYGCDALRFTLSISSGYNRNINLDPEKIEGYRNFVNKVWNAFRFISPYLDNANEDAIEIDQLHHHEKWILTELNNVIKNVTKSFDDYRFDDACNEIYHFVYEKFCSWFIELSKGILSSENEGLKAQRSNVLKYCFKKIVKLLHPVTPFITEEMWSYLKNEDESLLITQEYPTYNSKFEFNEDKDNMDKFIELTTSIRNLRNTVNLSPKEEVEVRFYTDDEALALYLYKSRGFLKELANVKSGKIQNKNEDKPSKTVMKATPHTDVFLPLEGVINIEEYSQKLERDLAKLQKEADKLSNKLKNPKFSENAPQDVVEKVKEEANGFNQQIKSLTETIEAFKQA